MFKFNLSLLNLQLSVPTFTRQRWISDHRKQFHLLDCAGRAAVTIECTKVFTWLELRSGHHWAAYSALTHTPSWWEGAHFPQPKNSTPHFVFLPSWASNASDTCSSWIWG